MYFGASNSRLANKVSQDIMTLFRKKILNTNHRIIRKQWIYSLLFRCKRINETWRDTAYSNRMPESMIIVWFIAPSSPWLFHHHSRLIWFSFVSLYNPIHLLLQTFKLIILKDDTSKLLLKGNHSTIQPFNHSTIPTIPT